MKLDIGIAGWAMWPRSGQAVPLASGEAPDVSDIPMMTRRRLGKQGKMALRVALDAGVDSKTRLVFSSARGDTDAVAKMLRRLAADEGVSAKDFSMSVHNAYAGVLSILQNNRQPHSAIAAGADSFAMGLLEAATQLLEEPNHPVMLVFYESALNTLYDNTQNEETSLALAIRFVGGQAIDAGRRLRISYEGGGEIPCNEIDVNDSCQSAREFSRLLTDEVSTWSWRASSGKMSAAFK